MNRQLLSSAQFFANVGKGPRKPLRTFTEMCEEFGVSKGVLQSALRGPDAPKAKLRQARRDVKNSWFDPDEMRSWWAKRTIPNPERQP